MPGWVVGGTLILATDKRSRIDFSSNVDKAFFRSSSAKHSSNQEQNQQVKFTTACLRETKISACRTRVFREAALDHQDGSAVARAISNNFNARCV